ncbi:hypothetical protein GW864_01095 [bacterium]|nr:hypothetical protein [bacterium]
MITDDSPDDVRRLSERNSEDKSVCSQGVCRSSRVFSFVGFWIVIFVSAS